MDTPQAGAAFHPSAKSQFENISPLLELAALLGIPAAGGVAILFEVQIPRFVYGQANSLLFVAEAGGLAALLALVILLRVCLALPTAPRGLYRDILDFLAVARWHPAVTAALIGLIVLPEAWYLHSGSVWLFWMLRIMGWRRALRSGDFQTQLDSLAVVSQLTLTAGIPLLFGLHMLTRWKPKQRFLPWLAVPVLFVAAAIGVILLVAIFHH